MKYYKDYTCYSRQEATDLLHKFTDREGTVFADRISGGMLRIQFVMVMPAHPILQELLVKLVVAFSHQLIPEDMIRYFENSYTIDEFIIGAFATGYEANPRVAAPLRIIPLQQVVGEDGLLRDDFPL